jgi:hypothetical protein
VAERFLDDAGLRYFWSKVKELLAGKAEAVHTHSCATADTPGFLSGEDKAKLDAAVETLDKLSSGGEYVAGFEAEDWTEDSNSCTMTIPAQTHGLAGTVVSCRAFALTGGEYREDVWCARATYATISGTGDITLHCPAGESYGGCAALKGYA